MNVTSCGYGYRHPTNFYIDRPNGSGDYLFLILKSDAWFEIDGERRRVREDSVILFERGIPQRYGAMGGEFVNHWVHFEAERDDLALWRHLKIPVNQPIPLGSTTSLSELIRSICDEMYSDSPYARQTANLYGAMLWYKLTELLRLDQPRAMQAHYEKLRELRNRIYREPERRWRVDDMAKAVAMSRSYFQHLYVRFFGVSVMSDVLDSRMAHAKYLLFRTEETVWNIAERCGYKSDVHFMRQFKRSVGMTPSEYRETRRRT